MTLVKEHVSHFEFCRMCFAAKDSFVDIFETVLFRDGCILADKLNELYGFEASPDDEQSKFICIDCVKTIKMLGNMTYGLWSTLDYLVRMHEDKQMEMASFFIPKGSLDFLSKPEKEWSSQSVELPSGIDLSRTSGTSCSKNDVLDCKKSDDSEGEEPVEYCWCTECNAEFLTRTELRIHLKTHRRNASMDNRSKATDLIESSMEFKVLSGEISLLRSELCCARCQKHFRNTKRLVNHIKKYDFKCKPRSFESLNNFLKRLKYIGPEDSALWNHQSENSSHEKVSKVHDSEASLQSALFGASYSMSNRCSLQRDKSTRDDSMCKGDEVTLGYSECLAKVKGHKFSREVSSYIRSHSSLVDSLGQHVPGDNNSVVDSGKMEKGVALLGKCLDSTNSDVICDYCNKPYTYKSKLRDHIVMCHLSAVFHKCFICHRVFLSESEFRTHSAKHSSENKYICSLCDDNFSSRAKVVMHLNELHNISKGIVCGVCFLGFQSRADLGIHQSCHSSDKKHKCSKCGKKYMNKSRFKLHTRCCQLGTFVHNCELCGKGFLEKWELRHHSDTHGTVKRHVCHLCPKKFNQSSSLCVHIRAVHLKLKPHECGICNRKFSIRRELVEHYTVHSDDRPFKCERCGKHFKSKKQFNAHLRSVHGACFPIK